MKHPVPCRDCEERTVGCHAGCERYKAWHAAHVEASRGRKLTAGERAARDLLTDGAMKNVRKWQRSGRPKHK